MVKFGVSFCPFLIIQTVPRTPWMGDQSVRRPLLTKDNANIHAPGGDRTHGPVFELACAVTVIRPLLPVLSQINRSIQLQSMSVRSILSQIRLGLASDLFPSLDKQPEVSSKEDIQPSEDY
jgi:hypothetical protein